jgi:hypothetical protein
MWAERQNPKDSDPRPGAPTAGNPVTCVNGTVEAVQGDSASHRVWQSSDTHGRLFEVPAINLTGFNGLPDTSESYQYDERGHEV